MHSNNIIGLCPAHKRRVINHHEMKSKDSEERCRYGGVSRERIIVGGQLGLLNKLQHTHTKKVGALKTEQFIMCLHSTGHRH